MSEEIWREVDRYLVHTLDVGDAALDEAVERSARAGLPRIEVSPLQGKLLMLLARLRGARRILEIGTLGGYSTIWLARALPAGGELVTLELQPAHAEVARTNLRRAGLDDRVSIRVGPAAETLATLERDGVEPFDLVFLDADKPSNPEYLSRVLRLSRPGTLIIVDNVIRGGRIADESNHEASVTATRTLHEMLGADPRLDATVIQTVGAKGHDGFAIALVGSHSEAEESTR